MIGLELLQQNYCRVEIIVEWSILLSDSKKYLMPIGKGHGSNTSIQYLGNIGHLFTFDRQVGEKKQITTKT